MSREFRAANRGWIGNFDLSKEAVATASNSFHKTRTLGGIAERVADFVDCFVQSVVEVHEGVCGPELFLKFLACDYLAGVLEQHNQDAEGLFLEPDSEPVLAQFASAKIQFENSEKETPATLMRFFHQKSN
jgi:hypothetical protein